MPARSALSAESRAAATASTGVSCRSRGRRGTARRRPPPDGRPPPCPFRRRGGGIAERALGVQVLRLPAELHRPVGAQMLELLDEGELVGAKVLGIFHAHQIGPEMQHHRGLDIAAMDAVERLLRRRHPFRQSEARPRGCHHQHIVAHAQFARHDIDHRHVAAVRIDHNELFDASALDAVADLQPQLGRRFPARRHRARRRDVLVGFADRLNRQEGHRQIIGQKRDRPPDHAFGDAGVGVDRQVGPVLFDRRHRQHGDPAGGVVVREIAGGHLDPIA